MPSATKMTELMQTGNRGNRKPAEVTAGPPMRAVRAAAPPGGWRDRVNDMAAIARETPTPMATIGSGMKWAARTPMNAEIVLPPMMGQGWANGLAGTAKRRTADAPIGATMSGMCGPSPKNQPQIRPVSVMPARAPRQPMRRSRRVAPARIGLKKRKPGPRLLRREGPMDSGIRELASVLKKNLVDQPNEAIWLEATEPILSTGHARCRSKH